jgi:hypothetical protein
MAPSGVHVQTAGAWKKGEMAEIQASRCDRFGWSVSNGAEPETAERHMAAVTDGV